MAARRPAKIATKKRGGFVKLCPSCKSNDKDSPMSIVKMVRQTKPSGMYWVCGTCEAEVPTRG
ncbi:MAG: hypothetical protein COW42_07095 [Deltaproteobacteria bacterium CG17_big_fil_post_rev_8_21_14_2_50_63_7]|nr:MAG: hypothetical protein COW42_07095 [Deltaproteobacteria bacterium CG17_big_fil_post_rev_8_21_14_2_50_63_7]